MQSDARKHLPQTSLLASKAPPARARRRRRGHRTVQPEAPRTASIPRDDRAALEDCVMNAPK